MLIAPDLLWLDGALRPDLAVRLERGVVVEVGPLGGAGPDLAPHLLIPGPTDLQVNGGGGTMLNADPTPEGLSRIVAAHRGLGTGEVLATVITDRPEVAEAAAEAVLAARVPGLLGLHLEGPHIAPERRGTHDPDRIRPLDARTVRLVERLCAAGVPVMLTLAPERADPALMRRMAAAGAVLSAGHSAASAAETRAALAEGVTCFTHLYNAMPPMTSRAPGLLGVAMVSDAFAGIIADGIHVDWDMVRLALAARPPGRTFVVSDAMATVGGPGAFELYGRTIRLRDGALVNAEGSLAGAHVDMVTSLANLHRHAGVPLARAVAMATDIPRAAMRLPPRRIAGGLGAEWLTALDANLHRTDLA